MSEKDFKQGQKDAGQGKGAANTNNMPHQEANSYNVGYKKANENSSKK